jgi:phosphoglycerate dehydrogenase-like enzyme
MSRPRVWYLPPESHTRKVFRPETYARLQACCQLTATAGEARVTAEEVADRLADFDGLVTGWGSPPIPLETLVSAARLRIVAHSAGSVKFLFTTESVRGVLIPRGTVVSSANGAIALNVAEATVGYLIAFGRGWFEQVRRIRETSEWVAPAPSASGQFLRGATVGLVSASVVGREVIRLLQPFDVRVLVYDPHLAAADAAALGVEPRPLDELLRESDFVSLHAPALPATRHLIGRSQLRLLRDDALLLNTARGSVLDHDALLDEARSGRIRVVLDVTDPEPLPGDHPLRRLPNVYITPHVSGSGAYGYYRIGETTTRAVEDCFAGRPVAGAVDLTRWEVIA